MRHEPAEHEDVTIPAKIAAAAVQLPKIAHALPVAAAATRTIAFSAPKAAFSTGTQPLRRSPMSAGSCSEKTIHAALPARKEATAAGPAVAKPSPAGPANATRNSPAAASPTTPATAYVLRMSRPARVPATGTKRMRTNCSPSHPMLVTNIIALMSAAASPTISDGYSRAASTQ